MSAHGRNPNEDFSPLVHHEAQQGRRLSASQRNDNNGDVTIYACEAEARMNASSCATRKAVRYRKVLED